MRGSNDPTGRISHDRRKLNSTVMSIRDRNPEALITILSILGKDFMQELGIDILNSLLTSRWDDIEIPMQEFGELCKWVAALDSFLMDIDTPSNSAKKYAKSRDTYFSILDAKYEKTNLAQLCHMQQHVTSDEQKMLHKLLTCRRIQTPFCWHIRWMEGNRRLIWIETRC